MVPMHPNSRTSSWKRGQTSHILVVLVCLDMCKIVTPEVKAHESTPSGASPQERSQTVTFDVGREGLSVGPPLAHASSMVVGLSAAYSEQVLHIQAEPIRGFKTINYHKQPSIRTPCCSGALDGAGVDQNDEQLEELLACASSMSPNTLAAKGAQRGPEQNHRIGILTQVTKTVLPFAAFAAAVNAAWAASFNHTLLVEGPMH
eukprot:1672012-Pyramimonas_sp.AAC.1